jgi:hypothetical protein
MVFISSRLENCMKDSSLKTKSGNTAVQHMNVYICFKTV